LKPSGLVPVGETITYWVLRLADWVVLPKWLAAVTASAPICSPVACDGAPDDSSTQTPTSAPPIG
jgi:hypothetical protein